MHTLEEPVALFHLHLNQLVPLKKITRDKVLEVHVIVSCSLNISSPINDQIIIATIMTPLQILIIIIKHENSFRGLQILLSLFLSNKTKTHLAPEVINILRTRIQSKHKVNRFLNLAMELVSCQKVIDFIIKSMKRHFIQGLVVISNRCELLTLLLSKEMYIWEVGRVRIWEQIIIERLGTLYQCRGNLRSD